MTKFQSADTPQRINQQAMHFCIGKIEQLHDDPEPFEQDLLLSSSANPEEILMAKEALFFGYSSDYRDHFERELNDESDCYFDGIAPTVNNLTKEKK